MKQSKLRKRRVVRYAIMYFSMFFLFLILVVGPVIVSKFFIPELSIMNLEQPTDWNNNDTIGTTQTGTALVAAATSATAAKRAVFHYGY